MNIFGLNIGESKRLRCSSSGKIVNCEDGLGGFQVASDAKGLTLQDLDSPSGTFLNGVEVLGIARLGPGDVITHEKCRLVVPDVERTRQPDTCNTQAGLRTVPGLRAEIRHVISSAILMEVQNEQQEPAKRPVLNDVSCIICPGEFVGILGTSGSGKSTLVKVIAGLLGIKSGEICLDGRTKTRSELLHDRNIAYLPQDVILHEQLTPIEALAYLVRLKGLADQAAKAEQLAAEALGRVSLGAADLTKRAIRNMSGGQRKRVALAAELLGDPRMLLLDEATSGLDPSTEEKMMQLFASLSREGRTVVCITHFPGRLHNCDRLLLLSSGRVICDGSPDELLEFFGVSSIEDVFGRQEGVPASVWEERFRKFRRDTPVHKVAKSDGLRSTSRAATSDDVKSDATPGFVRQFVLLSSRYCRLQAGDLRNLMLVCLQAPVIGLMIGLTYGSITVDFAELLAARTKEVCFLLVLAVLWCSGTASVREIVKEQAIFRHEMRYGIKVAPYLLSKIFVLGLISLLQTTLLLATVKSITELPGVGFGQWLVLALCGIAGVAVGLAVSAAVGTAERAMSILPVILIGQAILSGGLARLGGSLNVLALVANPAWWALDGLRATLGTALLHATYPGAPGYYQPPILGAGGPLGLDVAVLLIQTLVVAAAAAWLLIRRSKCVHV